MAFYKVQVVNKAKGTLLIPGGLYLVSASTPTILDEVGKGLINRHDHEGGDEYISQPVLDVPEAINRKDGVSIPLGRELTFWNDLSAIDWKAIYPFGDDDQGEA